MTSTGTTRKIFLGLRYASRPPSALMLGGIDAADEAEKVAENPRPFA